MNIKEALTLIRDDLLQELECIECQMTECIETMEILEDAHKDISERVEALGSIENLNKFKVVK